MATPEITLRGDLRDAVIGAVVRDVECSLDAVQAESGNALQTFDCLDLLNARAQARSLGNALELLARLVDPERVDREIEREREFAEIDHDDELVDDHDDELEAVAGEDDTDVIPDDRIGAFSRGSNWDEVDRTTASSWVGQSARVPEFLQESRNNRLNEVTS